MPKMLSGTAVAFCQFGYSDIGIGNICVNIFYNILKGCIGIILAFLEIKIREYAVKQRFCF